MRVVALVLASLLLCSTLTANIRHLQEVPVTTTDPESHSNEGESTSTEADSSSSSDSSSSESSSSSSEEDSSDSSLDDEEITMMGGSKKTAEMVSEGSDIATKIGESGPMVIDQQFWFYKWWRKDGQQGSEYYTYPETSSSQTDESEISTEQSSLQGEVESWEQKEGVLTEENSSKDLQNGSENVSKQTTSTATSQ